MEANNGWYMCTRSNGRKLFDIRVRSCNDMNWKREREREKGARESKGARNLL